MKLLKLFNYEITFYVFVKTAIVRRKVNVLNFFAKESPYYLKFKIHRYLI